jgi:hypothetical protein
MDEENARFEAERRKRLAEEEAERARLLAEAEARAKSDQVPAPNQQEKKKAEEARRRAEEERRRREEEEANRQKLEVKGPANFAILAAAQGLSVA